MLSVSTLKCLKISGYHQTAVVDSLGYKLFKRRKGKKMNTFYKCELHNNIRSSAALGSRTCLFQRGGCVVLEFYGFQSFLAKMNSGDFDLSHNQT